MKACLLHLFTICGGGERVSLEMARALHERSLEVIYVTNSAEGLKKCSELFGLPGNYKAIEARSLLEDMLSVTGRFIRYRRLLLLSRAYEKLKTMGVDGITIDTGTNMPFNVDVSCIHYPIALSTVEAKSLHWGLYNWLVKRKTQNMIGKPKLVMVNSKWTAELVKSVYSLDSVVLHPPVDVEYYAYDGRRKEKTILTISRLTPEKKLHMVSRIAFKLLDYEWYLVGLTGVSSIEKVISSAVHRLIKSEAEKWRAKNFYIVTDMPRRKLRELMLSSSFYVHPLFSEHFGIAVAEAMSAGCISIVYKDGGAWTDIVSLISQDLGYTRLEKVVSIIRKLESSSEQVNIVRRKAIELVKDFRAETFRKKFVKYLEECGVT